MRPCIGRNMFCAVDDFAQHLGLFLREMWFIDCLCIQSTCVLRGQKYIYICVNIVSRVTPFSLRARLSLILHHTISLIHQLIEKLSGLGVSPELSQLIAGCVWVRRGEVRSQMVRDSCAISHSHLTDFDWRVKVHQGWEWMLVGKLLKQTNKQTTTTKTMHNLVQEGCAVFNPLLILFLWVIPSYLPPEFDYIRLSDLNLLS